MGKQDHMSSVIVLVVYYIIQNVIHRYVYNYTKKLYKMSYIDMSIILQRWVYNIIQSCI